MSQRFLIALALLTLLGGCGSSGNDELERLDGRLNVRKLSLG
jgi:hypothetical protein